MCERAIIDLFQSMKKMSEKSLVIQVDSSEHTELVDVNLNLVPIRVVTENPDHVA